MPCQRARFFVVLSLHINKSEDPLKQEDNLAFCRTDENQPTAT